MQTLLLFVSILSFQANKTVFVDRVALKVNDKIITERELLYTYKARREEVLSKFKGAELDTQLKEAWKTTVQDAEETLLMYEKASELGQAYSQEDIRTELMSMKESRGLSDEEFEKAIEEQTGMTLSELIDQRQRENSAQTVFQSQVLGKIKIEDNEVARYYEQHQKEFMNPATYRIAEIVFSKDSANPEAALARANQCAAELAAGLDFAEAAKKYSDSLSKDNGGDLGLVKFGDLMGTIESQVRQLAVGSHSTVLATDNAWFIIKLLESNPENPKSVDEVREEIVNKLRQPRLETQLDVFMKKLRAEYSLTNYLPEMPWYLEY